MSRFAALTKGDRSDFLFCKQPKCPHCGSDFDIAANEAWRLYDENESHNVECPVCDGEFIVNSHATWRFSTDEQDEEP